LLTPASIAHYRLPSKAHLIQGLDRLNKAIPSFQGRVPQSKDLRRQTLFPKYANQFLITRRCMAKADNFT